MNRRFETRLLFVGIVVAVLAGVALGAVRSFFKVDQDQSQAAETDEERTDSVPGREDLLSEPGIFDQLDGSWVPIGPPIAEPGDVGIVQDTIVLADDTVVSVGKRYETAGLTKVGSAEVWTVAAGASRGVKSPIEALGEETPLGLRRYSSGFLAFGNSILGDGTFEGWLYDSSVGSLIYEDELRGSTLWELGTTVEADSVMWALTATSESPGRQHFRLLQLGGPADDPWAEATELTLDGSPWDTRLRADFLVVLGDSAWTVCRCDPSDELFRLDPSGTVSRISLPTPEGESVQRLDHLSHDPAGGFLAVGSLDSAEGTFIWRSLDGVAWGQPEALSPNGAPVTAMDVDRRGAAVAVLADMADGPVLLSSADNGSTWTSSDLPFRLPNGGWVRVAVSSSTTAVSVSSEFGRSQWRRLGGDSTWERLRLQNDTAAFDGRSIDRVAVANDRVLISGTVWREDNGSQRATAYSAELVDGSWVEVQPRDSVMLGRQVLSIVGLRNDFVVLLQPTGDDGRGIVALRSRSPGDWENLELPTELAEVERSSPVVSVTGEVLMMAGRGPDGLIVASTDDAVSWTVHPVHELGIEEEVVLSLYGGCGSESVVYLVGSSLDSSDGTYEPWVLSLVREPEASAQQDDPEPVTRVDVEPFGGLGRSLATILDCSVLDDGSLVLAANTAADNSTRAYIFDPSSGSIEPLPDPQSDDDLADLLSDGRYVHTVSTESIANFRHVTLHSFDTETGSGWAAQSVAKGRGLLDEGSLYVDRDVVLLAIDYGADVVLAGRAPYAD